MIISSLRNELEHVWVTAYSIRLDERRQGLEAVNMISKGQVKRPGRNEATGRVNFVASVFQIAV